ncbi:cation:proton antiporter [Oricola cellulosilytica]|uniref:Sodium:proton antiporter n=1 Tax=Oricola cellulosilytica TaxID=1429082 RepID=A0A4R0PI49_9HYPH|nr:sodium:proton antiporter [Oricola cellulosilytica]TCD15224.1 sodium:proton antiporter [Oricola cellulosilytica]
MEHIAAKLAFIGAAGIGAQWLAWRLKLPAIVLLLAAGFLAGPVTGFIQPSVDFGDIYQPVVGLAVAIILFEGGLTLNFREIRETSTAVRRIILFGGPLTWLGSTLAAHYIGGLSWAVSTILGAILVVTGPTVIMPLLRSAKLKSRPASLLRWEAIVNDPIGALFAVISFEVFLVLHGSHGADSVFLNIAIAFVFAVAGGFAAGRALVWAFIRGHVPEYLKAPVLLASVIAIFSASNLILEESGLLTVTIMGITMANSRLASLGELRRFKETITILLVSGLFIVLTAALEWPVIMSLDLRALGFVIAVLFVIRPIAIFAATTGSGLTWQERLLTAWIAPRGIVAVAVASLFGSLLTASDAGDGQRMVAFTFAVVVATIFLHGFTLGPLARLLDLRTAETPGILIVGGYQWTTALARKLQDMKIPVTIADPNWNHLSEARQAGIETHFGEPLSEHAHHNLNIGRFGALVAATDNDAYNALICTDFGPEIGRNNVYQIGDTSEQSERRSLNFTIGGKQFFQPGMTHRQIRQRHNAGWTFQTTRLTEEFDRDAYMASRLKDTRIILWRKPDGTMIFEANCNGAKPQKEDQVLSFGPAKQPETAREIQEEREKKSGDKAKKQKPASEAVE